MFARPQQVRTKACTPANHLPEFRSGSDRFVENEVDTFGHINAGVEHIHRNGNMRGCFRFGELFYEIIGVLLIVVDNLAEVTTQVWELLVEPLLDEQGVFVASGKDDGFTQPVATSHFDTLFHQAGQHLIHRVFIEEPCI